MGNQESKIQADGLDIRKFSHFAQCDLKEWSSYFKMYYPRGYITQEDLEKLLQAFFPFGNPTNFCNTLFQTINIGQSGCIDFNELLIAFSILVKGSKYEKLRWIFRFYDKDRDGVVSREEITEILGDMHSMIKETIQLEFNPVELVNNIFSSLENQSGFLTFNDFDGVI